MRTAPLALDDCATRRVNAMIDQMRAGGRFNGLIALVRTGAVINHGLDGSLAGVMEGFYLHAQGIASLSWVPQLILRNVVDLAFEIAYQVEDNAQAIANFIYTHSLFGENQAGLSRCDTDEGAPLCNDFLCVGDNNNKCSLVKITRYPRFNPLDSPTSCIGCSGPVLQRS
ncbi:hypothetical protein ABVK25_007589 [Lepraria finkii]|uniref:Uncharacterized protein n=1 Tax=Lepraria finkii TaxID=1340010 RepID=A0ABR4B2L1_9LECA